MSLTSTSEEEAVHSAVHGGLLTSWLGPALDEARIELLSTLPASAVPTTAMLALRPPPPPSPSPKPPPAPPLAHSPSQPSATMILGRLVEGSGAGGMAGGAGRVGGIEGDHDLVGSSAQAAALSSTTTTATSSSVSNLTLSLALALILAAGLLGYALFTHCILPTLMPTGATSAATDRLPLGPRNGRHRPAATAAQATRTLPVATGLGQVAAGRSSRAAKPSWPAKPKAASRSCISAACISAACISDGGEEESVALVAAEAQGAGGRPKWPNEDVGGRRGRDS